MLFKSVAHRMYSISASVLAPNLKLAPTLNNMHPPYRQEKLISAFVLLYQNKIWRQISAQVRNWLNKYSSWKRFFRHRKLPRSYLFWRTGFFSSRGIFFKRNEVIKGKCVKEERQNRFLSNSLMKCIITLYFVARNCFYHVTRRYY